MVDVAAARGRLGLTTDALAAELNVTPAVVEAWESRRIGLTTYAAEWLTFKVAAAERAEALRAAGLPPCEALLALTPAAKAGTARAALRQLEVLEQHAATCPVCTARQAYVDAHFPPMPPAPLSGGQGVLVRLVGLVRRLPPWARPAAVGGGVLFAIVAVRVLFALPGAITHPRALLDAAIALGAATGAGAAGGLVYSAVRGPFRRFGRLGDYLTGVACVLAYMGALALVAPVAFGEPLVKDRSDLGVFAILSVGFGLLIGHTWFRARVAGGALSESSGPTSPRRGTGA
jgi:hypothetical protein